MDKPLHTTTLQLSCDVEIIVPPNFETLPNEDKIRIVYESLKNEYIKSVEICYIDEVEETINAMY